METSTLVVRPYEDADESATVDLLVASLGAGPAGARPPEFFRWKHLENPFGRSFMLVAEADGRLVGLRAFMRWRFTVGDRVLSAVRAVDTATHPDYQGRGIFARLTLDALEALRGSVDFVFNTPNSKSLPGYLKMGWRPAGTFVLAVRPAGAVRLLGAIRKDRRRPDVSAAPALAMLEDPRVHELVERSRSETTRLSTPRDIAYLRWRYGTAPLLDYRAVADEEEGVLRGIAIFRVRPRLAFWETSVTELIVPDGEKETARRLLRMVRHAAKVDHLATHFPDGSTAANAARRGGFVRSPRRITFVVNPLREGIDPDPADQSSWALTLGDLEVF